jgi:hypothetical protein
MKACTERRSSAFWEKTAAVVLLYDRSRAPTAMRGPLQKGQAMTGIIVFYITYYSDLQQDLSGIIDLVLKTNVENAKSHQDQAGYDLMIIPTTKEACRVEKVDFDKPLPYCVTVASSSVTAEEDDD